MKSMRKLHESFFKFMNVWVNKLKKTAGLFQPKFGSNMDKPKCWVKNV